VNRLSTLALASSILWLIAGCGDSSAPSGGDSPSAEGGDVPVTPRALAAVAAEHIGEPGYATHNPDDEYGADAVSADLRFDADGEYDGDLLAVVVGWNLPRWARQCGPESGDGCEKTDEGLLKWEEQEPEEDPGTVLVSVRKGETTVLVYQSGFDITGDPRTLDMPISVDDMFAVATDARVDLTTSQAAIDSGEDLMFWDEDAW
jgi:hypothetical protein